MPCAFALTTWAWPTRTQSTSTSPSRPDPMLQHPPGPPPPNPKANSRGDSEPKCDTVLDVSAHLSSMSQAQTSRGREGRLQASRRATPTARLSPPSPLRGGIESGGLLSQVLNLPSAPERAAGRLRYRRND